MSDATFRRIEAVGVTLPVHNEERRLGRALESLGQAFSELNGSGIMLRAVIVLDACRDESEAIAYSWKREIERSGLLCVDVLKCEYLNVGSARALGCDVLLDRFRGARPSSVWLATTDADSRVPPRWLTVQLAWHYGDIDAWVGRVTVNDWTPHRRDTALRWQREYERERRPIHGANLGFVAQRYLAVGGFRSLPTGEDRALVKALLDDGADVHFDALTRVATSSRRRARAPRGFSVALRSIEDSILESSPRVQESPPLDKRAVG
ncbi:MAG: glycosyl transferase [Acidimicrobiaceae bacterium]|nr:glycosyl transferase [Acidimicrobiaceae bacterium]